MLHHFQSPTQWQTALVLTASVFQSVDGVGEQAYAAQEPRSLLLVDLLVVPNTDGDGVGFTDVPDGAQEVVREVEYQQNNIMGLRLPWTTTAP